MRVSTVLIQGRADNPQWVKSFKLGTSGDGQTFAYVTSEGVSASADDAVVFDGNTDQTTVVEQQLPAPRFARFLRLYPQSWHRHISMRWEVMACDARESQADDHL